MHLAHRLAVKKAGRLIKFDKKASTLNDAHGGAQQYNKKRPARNKSEGEIANNNKMKLKVVCGPRVFAFIWRLQQHSLSLYFSYIMG